MCVDVGVVDVVVVEACARSHLNTTTGGGSGNDDDDDDNNNDQAAPVDKWTNGKPFHCQHHWDPFFGRTSG